jgi:hypothetical protein
MGTRLSFLALGVMLCGGGSNADDQPRRWEPVSPGVVLTRNFMVPASPTKEGYHLMPQKYRMGSKAYGRSPPDWWVKLAREAKVDPKWHKDDLPLAYAGEFKSKDGTNVLLVVELYHAFSGDGFLTPGGEVYLVAREFSIEGGNSKLVSDQHRQAWCNLSDLQYSRLFGGEAKGRRIEFRQEMGPEFDSRTVKWKKESALVVGDDNSLKFEKGEWVQ